MRIFSILLFALICSCTATKKPLAIAFDKAYIRDTAYFTIHLPLRTNSTGVADEMNKIMAMGYVDLLRYTKQNLPVYKTAEKAKKYLKEEYYDKDRDDEHIAVFNYYRVKDVRFNSQKWINNKRDSAEATLKVDYDVVPMFNVEDNPKYITVLFVKDASGWEVANAGKMNSDIYFVKYVYDNLLNCCMTIVRPETLREKFKKAFN